MSPVDLTPESPPRPAPRPGLRPRPQPGPRPAFQRGPARLAAAALAVITASAGCGGGGEPKDRLHVVVRATPAAWYFESGRPRGVDHDLLVRFAESLNVELEVSHVANTAAALDALCKPRAQLAAGLLSPPAGDGLRLGPRYGELKLLLLRRFDRPAPSSTTDLIMENVEIGDEPVQAEALRAVKQRNGDLTRWRLHRDLSPHDLIELTDRGFVEYTVADSYAVAMSKRFYPRIKETFDLSPALPVHWVFGDCAEERIVLSARRFFAAAQADRTLAQILDRYYGHAERLSYPDKLTFIENADRRLVRYRHLFVEAAAETGLDWRLLAALSYQESRWNPRAQSPSGVQGLMMLTLETAKQLGVEDRQDPRGSIAGGARFLRDLKKRFPPEVGEPDRTWFALAAYNSGFNRVERARKAARGKGLDPALWVDVRDFLRTGPRAEPRVEEGVEKGARRKTPRNLPFTYVYKVRAYRDLLAWSDGALRFDVHGEAPQAGPPAPAPM